MQLVYLHWEGLLHCDHSLCRRHCYTGFIVMWETPSTLIGCSNLFVILLNRNCCLDESIYGRKVHIYWFGLFVKEHLAYILLCVLACFLNASSKSMDFFNKKVCPDASLSYQKLDFESLPQLACTLNWSRVLKDFAKDVAWCPRGREGDFCWTLSVPADWINILSGTVCVYYQFSCW